MWLAKDGAMLVDYGGLWRPLRVQQERPEITSWAITQSGGALPKSCCKLFLKQEKFYDPYNLGYTRPASDARYSFTRSRIELGGI